MKFVRFDYSAGMCGTDSYEFGKFDLEKVFQNWYNIRVR